MRTRVIDAVGPVHLADFGGEGPMMVLVHGLGGSHVNWVRLGPLLAERARVIAPDMAGFGKTPPAGRSTAVQANAVLLDRIIRAEDGVPAILVGNSMGGLISILEAVARPASVAGLILLDPALPQAAGARPERQVSLAFAAYMTPGIGELFVRRRLAVLGPEGMVRETFTLCCVDPSRVPQEVVEAHVEMLRARTRMPWVHSAVLRASRSMMAVILRRRRFLQMLRRVEVPTLLVQGERDRLATAASARVVARLHPEWTYRVLDDLGHTPHLEDPERTAGEMWSWLEGPGREAWDRAAAGAAGAAPDQRTG